MKEFIIKVDYGDIFINGEFVAQLCWEPEAIGFAITNWLKDECGDSD